MEQKEEGQRKKTLKLIAQSVQKTKSKPKDDMGDLVLGLVPNNKKSPKSKTRSIDIQIGSALGGSAQSVQSAKSAESKKGVTANNPPLAKQDIRKLCEEVMDEFRQEALDICLQRLMGNDGAGQVALELRDTWLRIVEAEWMDEVVQSQSILKTSLVKPDVPPLPMSFDFWSKGALQILPNSRRDSVMDPFIRSVENTGGQRKPASGTSSVETIGGGDGMPLPVSSKPNVPQIRNTKGSISTLKSNPARTSIDHEGSKTVPSKKSLDGGDGPTQENLESINNSLTRTSSKATNSSSAISVEFIQPPVAIKSSGSIQYRKMRLKPWTVSQCGANDGSGGVYRLVNQSTSEAIAKSLQIETQIQEDKLEATNSMTIEDLAKHSIDTEESMLEMISQSDKDTETLYENNLSDNDGTSKSVSIISSDTNNEMGVPPREKYVDYKTLFTKGLRREAESKRQRGGTNDQIKTTEDVDQQHFPNPTNSQSRHPYKPFGNKAKKPKKLFETPEPGKTVPKATNPQPNNKGVISRVKTDLIKQHRDSMRSRLSKQTNSL